jgi:hypothetical protein
MSATISTLQATLKDDYLPPMNEQLNNNVLIVQRVEKSSKEIFGNQAVVPLHTGRTSGIGARAENGPIPAAGNQAFAKAVYDVKFHYGHLSISGPSIAKTRSDVGSFVRGLEAEMSGLQNDLKKDMARILYNDGTGAIAQCAASGPSTTITLGSDEALRKGQIYNGMIVDIGVLGAPVLAVAQPVTLVNITAKTFAITASVTTTTSHFVFRAGNVLGGTVNEANGLKSVVNATANQPLGGITPVNDYWDNLRLPSGGTLSITLMQQAWNTVVFNGETPSAIYTSLGCQRAYYLLLQSQVRYVDATTLKGGFKVLTFMDEPLIADIDAPFGTMYFLCESYLRLFTMSNDWFWLEEDGKMLKWVQQQDGWEAVIANYFNFGATRRNVQLCLTGITDTTGL